MTARRAPRAGALALALALLAAAALPGCLTLFDHDPRVDGPLEAWREAAAAHGPVGVEAAFDVTGRPLHATGDLAADVAAPFHLALAPAFHGDPSFAFFPNATVAGHGAGLLVVEGGRLAATAGAVAGLWAGAATANGSVAVAPRDDFGAGKPEANFSRAWPEADNALFFMRHTPAAFDAVVLTNYSRALLVTAAGARELPATVTVTAGAVLWDLDSRVEAPLAVVQAERFALGGNVTGGRLDVDGPGLEGPPSGVFGRDARLELEGARARSLAPFRLTQALDAAGAPLLGAEVEVAPEALSVTVAEGGERWVRVAYREAGFTGDAIIENVTVAGDGAGLVTVPVEAPPHPVEALWALVEGSGYAAPFVALPIALASPWVALAEGLRCLLAGCPENQPYPAWMDAGGVGVFYFKVEGAAAPGDYRAEVTITGQNHAPVRFTVDVAVEPAGR